MSRLARDGTAEPVSRGQIPRRQRGQGNIIFPCSADHDEQDWQPYPVDPYSLLYVCVAIHIPCLSASFSVLVSVSLEKNDEGACFLFFFREGFLCA